MKVKEIARLLDAEALTGDLGMEREIKSACGSDMMSDVLAYVKDQALLLTGLTNPQVIRTAEMMDMHCVVFVRGKRPDACIVDMARDRDIAVLATEQRMFLACGILYVNGVKEGSNERVAGECT